MMGIEFALFEEAEDFSRFGRTDDGTQTNGNSVSLRNHNAQAAGNNANHEITFGSAVQDSVADLLYNSNAVVWVNDFVADLVVHS